MPKQKGMIEIHEYPRGTAIIYYFEDGTEKQWAIGASVLDNEETLRSHLLRWHPSAQFIRYEMV